MRAQASIVAASVAEGTRYRVLRSEPPLLLRPTPDALMLVGGAAGPLGGDELRLDVEVEAGTRLRVASAAATVVLPGSATSHVELRIKVRPGAHLDWLPEALISVRGSQHRVDTHIELAKDATMCFEETLVLGRSGETSGHVASHLRVERDGTALHHQHLDIGGDPLGGGAAVIGDASVVVTALEVGPAATSRLSEETDDWWGARMALAHDVALTQVLAGDTVAAEKASAELVGYRTDPWSDH